MPRPVIAVQQQDDSNTFPFLYGSFDLPGWTIPYLSVVMPFKDAAMDLMTTYDLPKADQNEWTIEELFQRDLDWVRVDSEVVPYLRNPAEPAFFPSLTVAMLPYNQDDNVQLENFRDWSGFSPPDRWDDGDQFGRVESVGPITIGWYNSWNQLSDVEITEGQVRWNKSQINGIAIDGQHRLAAIKTIYQSHQRDEPKFRNARQPALILIFDEMLGFAPPEGMDDKSLVELIRQLFIDLNKHARKVHRARLILLEDLEPHARCVREVLAGGIAGDIDSLTDSAPRLPLSLVDWHSENAKFDRGPYLTSVLTLDWIVAEILGRKVIGDFTRYSALRLELRALKRSLKVDLDTALARVSTNENEQVPFSYKPDELKQICAEFGRLFPASVCYLLSEFVPYAALIALRNGGDTFGLEFQHWYFLLQRKPLPGSPHGGNAEREYQQWLLELLARPGGRTEAEFEAELNSVEQYKKNNLAFNIAFQRAYFLAWLEYKEYKTAEIDAIEGRQEIDIEGLAFDEEQPDFNEPLSDDESSEEQVGVDEEDGDVTSLAASVPQEVHLKNSAIGFVEAMNRLVNSWPDALSVQALIDSSDMILSENRNGLSAWFWGGTLLKTDDQAIDYSQSASNRAGDLLFLIVAMITYDTQKDSSPGSDFNEFWDDLIHEPNPLSYIKRARRAVNRQVKEDSPKGFAARILQQQEVDYDKEMAHDEIEVRLKFIWKTLGL